MGEASRFQLPSRTGGVSRNLKTAVTLIALLSAHSCVDNGPHDSGRASERERDPISPDFARLERILIAQQYGGTERPVRGELTLQWIRERCRTLKSLDDSGAGGSISIGLMNEFSGGVDPRSFYFSLRGAVPQMESCYRRRLRTSTTRHLPDHLSVQLEVDAHGRVTVRTSHSIANDTLPLQCLLESLDGKSFVHAIERVSVSLSYTFCP